MKFHIGFFALSFVGLFLLIQTGDNGAKMVFKHGVGVQATEIENPVRHDHETGHDEMVMQEESSDSTIAENETAEHGHNENENSVTSTSFNKMDNGDWTWETGEHAVTALKSNFHWLSGSPEAASAKAVKTGNESYALSFSGEDLNGFFVGHDSYQNVQVDYRLDVSALNGTVSFVHHVQDSDSYDYVSISSDGTVQQGRMVDGQPEVFEQGQTDVSKPLFVRVVSSGSHFRGYVDKQMVVHGHGDAPEAGGVGLKLEGNGTVLLDKITLTQLSGH